MKKYIELYDMTVVALIITTDDLISGQTLDR